MFFKAVLSLLKFSKKPRSLHGLNYYCPITNGRLLFKKEALIRSMPHKKTLLNKDQMDDMIFKGCVTKL
jgi:hypothetical protein